MSRAGIIAAVVFVIAMAYLIAHDLRTEERQLQAADDTEWAPQQQGEAAPPTPPCRTRTIVDPNDPADTPVHPVGSAKECNHADDE